jgi:glutamate-1-semialdehyde 2,1-aminomutase
MHTATVLSDRQRTRLTALRQREDDRFRSAIPNSLALDLRARAAMPNGVPMAWMAGLFRTPPIWAAGGSGSRFSDIDGNSYVDFNLCDMSAMLGYGHPRLTEVIAEQAARGVQLMLPVEAVLTVCEQLRLRFGLPKWQFTLAASTANQEALRIARVATGRDGVLLFTGKYHGHLDETLWVDEGGGDGLTHESLGVGAAPPAELAIVDFNDLEAAERVLARERTAAVLVEGVLTNWGTILPEPGFLPGLREVCTRTGTLLVMDETHTQFDRYGGAVGHYGIAADMVTGGKGIAGGIPIGAYGMTEELAGLLETHLENDAGPLPGIAVGGTLFGNALSLACAAVVLSELMTPVDYERIVALGGRLSDGIDAAVRAHGLDWRATRFGARAGYCLTPELPRRARDADPSLDPVFTDARRVYFANRGVWEAIATSGPHAGFAHTDADIDDYLTVLDDFLDELTRDA